ncbi:MAG: toll/interleukin-1 receptor domain-containing protein [Kiritimatiellae bacterium]|jgi:hypothetical protein|nr:toll/interleukin-1 receptor domain-containing protein [Kiritimatiellia bacterium]
MKLFLSHSSVDKTIVKRLANDLKSTGISVWLDEWEIKVGDRITQKINCGLDDSDYVAIWLTKAAISSKWVALEWQSRFADEIAEDRVIILPLLAEECHLPPLLRDVKYADFKSQYSIGIQQLLERCGIDSRSRNAGFPLLHGNWSCHDGTFGLSQFKDDVYGTYDWMGRSQVGRLTGRIIGSRLIFRWRNHALEGVGIFSIRDETLQGGWWMEWEGPSFYELMENPDFNIKEVHNLTRFSLRRSKQHSQC